MTPPPTAAFVAPDANEFQLQRIKEARAAILNELRKLVVGQEEPLEQILIGMFAGGHLMIQGPPGTAKTLFPSPGS
jgi:MoxR-like ATPase